MPKPRRVRGVHGHDDYRPTMSRGGYVATPQARPRVPLTEVACATCGAQPGERCKATTGTVLTSGHSSRRIIATRLYNRRREEAMAAAAAEPEPAARVVERVHAGVHSWHAECSLCGWSCTHSHEPHWREATAERHAKDHTCP